MSDFTSMPGMDTSTGKTCFLGSSADGIAILVDGKEHHLRYTDFPWFEHCSTAELRNVTSDRWGVYWNDLGIDLSLESIKAPERFPERISVDAWLKARNRKAARTLGSIRSGRKAAGSRANGRKGGRPPKQADGPATA